MADNSDEDISVVKHVRKSRLFNHGKPWIKNNNSDLFDATMGSYDGAEICELVDLFILNRLRKKFGKKNLGLYRDNGLAIIKKNQHVWQTKPEKSTTKFGTICRNLHVVNFFDVAFDLATQKYKPYRKP